MTHQQTGPKTAKGKSISSRNSLKHGLGSQAILLPWESEHDYEKHRAEVREAYPVNVPAQADAVESIAQLQWKKERNQILMNRMMVAEQNKPITELEIDREIGNVKVNRKSLFDIMNIGAVYVKDAKVLEYEQSEQVLKGIQLWRLLQAGEDVALEEIYAYLSPAQRTIMSTINSNDFIAIDREFNQFEKDASAYIEGHPECGWILHAIESIKTKRIVSVLTHPEFQRHNARLERSLEKEYDRYDKLSRGYIDGLPDVSKKNHSLMDAQDVISR